LHQEQGDDDAGILPTCLPPHRSHLTAFRADRHRPLRCRPVQPPLAFRRQRAAAPSLRLGVTPKCEDNQAQM
jgi:hypothetical protein